MLRLWSGLLQPEIEWFWGKPSVNGLFTAFWEGLKLVLCLPPYWTQLGLFLFFTLKSYWF